jgi:hypothetical protein
VHRTAKAAWIDSLKHASGLCCLHLNPRDLAACRTPLEAHTQVLARTLPARAPLAPPTIVPAHHRVQDGPRCDLEDLGLPGIPVVDLVKREGLWGLRGVGLRVAQLVGSGATVAGAGMVAQQASCRASRGRRAMRM